ncbi:MAG: PEP-CTERM sorting domain-containing protein [Phycisphaerales bacterium]|jgi:hypothetical protein|nr:PEP-CTERM sorting domain-containing protein [Phycisphaerales bacterium]MBT7171703.1 PEP-CTERM sorting domain-containing protein [Phycisphaerales bacterium]
MKTKTYWAGCCILLALGTGVASAKTMGYQTEYSEGNPIETTPYTMTLSQFDTQNDTRVLTGVTLSFTAQQSASIAFENGASSPVEGSADMSGAFVTFQGTGNVNDFEFLSISTPTPTHDFAANEGGGQVYNGTGDDYWNFGSLESETYTYSKTSWSSLDAFEGTGEISYDLTSVGSWVLTGGGDVQATVSDYITAGVLRVDYEWEPVPEPTTMALLALGGIAMLKRRKRA